MKSLKIKYNKTRVNISNRAGGRILALVAICMIFLLLASVVPGAAAEPEAQDLSWTIYDVDSPKYFDDMRDRSLAYDTSGNPHIAYGGDHLYYVWYNGTNWISETVDANPQVGQYAALALDNSNRPRISYYDAYNGSLKFAYKMSGVWIIQTLDSPTESTSSPAVEKSPELKDLLMRMNPGLLEDRSEMTTYDAQYGVGRYSSIAVDETNVVHISYHDDQNGVLRYANWDGATWYINPQVDRDLGSETDVGSWSSIAVDDSERVFISYMSEKYDNLKYARSDDGGVNWEIETVDEGPESSPHVGSFTSIALDSSNRVHISYLDFSYGEYKLKYATNKTGAWNRVTVDNDGEAGWDTSIAINSKNEIRISYYDEGEGNLKYATSSGGGWSVKTLYHEGEVGRFTSVAYDKNDLPGISFYHVDSGVLYYTHYDGSSWKATGLDTSGNVGLATSLAISSGDFPYISYFSDVGDNLKYARGVGSLWSTEVVASQGTVGQYSSIQVDANGRPRIAYYDATNGDLKYAWWDGVWHFSTVDSADDVGQFVSMVLDTLGRPHFSYYDATDGDLRMATFVGTGGNCGTGNAWECETVDSAGDVGKYSSIAVDPLDDLPIISYYDASNGALKLAIGTAVGWAIKTIHDPLIGGSAGLYTSLKLDSTGKTRIAYYFSNFIGIDSLRYAKYVGGGAGVGCDDDNYECEIVDSGEKVGKYTSIALDSSDRPRIAYYDQANDALMYAFEYGGNWTIRKILPTNSGQFASLYVDGNNSDLTHIAHYDGSNGKLGYAVYVGSGGNCGFDSSSTQFQWQCDWIDESVGTSTHPKGVSLAVDAANNPVIAYQSGASVLKVARPASALNQLIGNCGPATPFFSWQCDPISFGITITQGDYISLAVNSAGLATIAYYGNSTATDGDLKVAAQRLQIFLPLTVKDG